MITHRLVDILTIIFACTTIGLVILNQPQSSDTFGGTGSIVQTRRGFEKKIHQMTILSICALVVLALASQVLK